MFTILHRRPDGSEVLREDAVHVSRITEPVKNLGGDIVQSPGVVVRWSDGIETNYQHPSTGEPGKHEEIFVMNRFGATVATYRL